MCESCVSEDGTVEIEGRKMRYIDPLTDWGFKRLFGSEMNKEELDEYTNDMMTENDRRNAIDYARKQGRAEGEMVGKRSVAQRMLAAGLDPKMISEMTGLTEPEIRGL